MSTNVKFFDTFMVFTMQAPVNNADIHKKIMSIIVQDDLDKNSPRQDAGVLFKILGKTKVSGNSKIEKIALLVRHKAYVQFASIERNVEIVRKFPVEIDSSAPVAFSCDMAAVYTPMETLDSKEQEALEFLGFSAKKVSSGKPVRIPDSIIKEKIVEKFARKGVSIVEDSVVVANRYNHGAKKSAIPSVTFYALADVSADTVGNFSNVVYNGIGKGLNYGLGMINIIDDSDYNEVRQEYYIN